MKIAICDDDPAYLDSISKLLYSFEKEYSIELEVSCFTRGCKAIEFICTEKNNVDLIFLDIEIPQINGIEVAKELRKNQKDLIIIYVSSHEQYWMELFEVQPFRFVKKPVVESEIRNVLILALSILFSEQKFFIYNYKKSVFRIPQNDIYYFESILRKIYLYDKKNEKIGEFYGTMNQLEKDLRRNTQRFIRAHQSYLVNYDCIKKWSQNKIELLNGVEIPTSEIKAKKAKSLFFKLLEEET